MCSSRKNLKKIWDIFRFTTAAIFNKYLYWKLHNGIVYFII